MLAVFLVQGFWLISRQTLTDIDYQYARCGRETWEKPSPLAGYYTSCGNIHDGILAYRLAGLPLTLNLLAERGLDRLRKPENRVVQERRRAEHVGAAPSNDAHPAAAAAAISLCRLPAGRMHLVGHATALRQSGRLYGAGALLLFARGAAGLRHAKSRGAGCAGPLRRRVYLHWRCPCHAGPAAQVAPVGSFCLQ